MKTKFVLLAVCFLLSTAVADTLSVRKPQCSRVGAYTLEGLGALPGMAGCYCLGMGFGAAAFMTAWSGGSKSVVFVGAVSLEVVSLALLPPTAAWGTISVGERLGRHGSRGWAIGGAYAGLAVAVGSMALGVAIDNSTRRRAGRSTYWYVPFTVLSGLAIPVGSVVGYNLGAPSRGQIGSRLELPAVGLTGTERPDRSVDYGVKVQLAGLRF